MDDLHYDFYEFRALMEQTTKNLKQMSEMQAQMRWQFGEPEWYQEFIKEMNDAQLGWISSNC
jgi:hypothetical protein